MPATFGDGCKLQCMQLLVSTETISFSELNLSSKVTNLSITENWVKLDTSNTLYLLQISLERFQSVTGSLSEEWSLVDVAYNNTRGSRQRLRDKREKLIKANYGIFRMFMSSTIQCSQNVECQVRCVLIACSVPTNFIGDGFNIVLYPIKYSG